MGPPFSIRRVISKSSGTREAFDDSRHDMTRFRFVTPHRIGKWYNDLGLAQRFANAIGAGFLDPRSGRFIAYRETRLETATIPASPE